MCIFFPVSPGTGHVHPLVPIAKALEAAGHEVAFASAASFGVQVVASDLQFFPAGIDFEEYEAVIASARAFASESSRPFGWLHRLPGAWLVRMLPDLLALAIRAVLADPPYRTSAQKVRDEKAAMPGPEYAVRLLERLAVEKQPLLTS